MLRKIHCLASVETIEIHWNSLKSQILLWFLRTHVFLSLQREDNSSCVLSVSESYDFKDFWDQNNWCCLQTFKYIDHSVKQKSLAFHEHHFQTQILSLSSHVCQVFVNSLVWWWHVVLNKSSILIQILFLTSLCCLALQSHNFSFLNLLLSLSTVLIIKISVYDLQYCCFYSDCCIEELNLQFYNFDLWCFKCHLYVFYSAF